MDEVKSRLDHEDGAVLGWHSGVRRKKGWGSGVDQHLRSQQQQQRSGGHRGTHSSHRGRGNAVEGVSWKARQASERDGSVCMSAGTHSRPMHLGTAAFNGAVCTAA